MLTPADQRARSVIPADYCARCAEAAEKDRSETRTITLSVSDVNDFALDDAELAAKVRRLWLEAVAS